MPERCPWALAGGPSIGDAYLRYHDEVWGVPQREANVLFEFLILEGAQAGLSWSTILRKLEGYRRAYRGFDPRAVAGFDDDDVARLLADEGIVRNRAKVDASIRNARAWLELDDPVAHLWSFVDGVSVQNAWSTMADVPAETDRSRAMSADLKRRGFGFVGPTICYAFMQATGMVNDHLTTCFRYEQCRALA
ncbi:MAG TPA: DNA-3-methyladenine glycosylase I [Ilumatobacteraceae bacterium]|nr:DNA-3-methyladenine glycosylase I [Ilumatobacteraceae bacterium]